jgi:hypothetical protein
MARRSRVFQELERAITRGFYDDAEDAEMRARAIQAAKDPRAAAIESTLSSGKPEGDLRDEAL